MIERKQCAFTIDSLSNDRRRGRGNRPWWRRKCKRLAVVGGLYCWQHQPRNVEGPEDPPTHSESGSGR